VVQTSAFILRNYQTNDLSGTYIRLLDFNNSILKSENVREAIVNPNVTYRYRFNQNYFKEIPGSPIVYWATNQVVTVFEKGERLEDIASPRQGLATGNNDEFIRLWFVVNNDLMG